MWQETRPFGKGSSDALLAWRNRLCAGRDTNLVELNDLVGIALKKLQEGCLRTGGTLGASEQKALADCLDILEVEHEFLDPLGRSLSCFGCQHSVLGAVNSIDISCSYQQ